MQTLSNKSPINRMRATRILAFAVLSLCATASQACRVAPKAQLIGVDEQLRLAAEVAVGQVIGATPISDVETEYRFLVLDQLAGTARKTFTVMGRAAGPYDKHETFDRHRDIAFWARGGGRVMNGTDCAIHPSFAVGHSYLVFLGAPPTRRSFEEVDTIDGQIDAGDQWLAYVRHKLSGAAASREGEPEYERVGRFIYGFHRLVSRDALDRTSLAAQHAPAVLLQRAGRLADEFDHIVKEHPSVPDAEMYAALREAAEVSRLLKDWRDGAGN